MYPEVPPDPSSLGRSCSHHSVGWLPNAATAKVTHTTERVRVGITVPGRVCLLRAYMQLASDTNTVIFFLLFSFFFF